MNKIKHALANKIKHAIVNKIKHALVNKIKHALVNKIKQALDQTRMKQQYKQARTKTGQIKTYLKQKSTVPLPAIRVATINKEEDILTMVRVV